MSFWEDASPVVKGAIVIGVLGLSYFGVAYFAGLPPFGSATDEEISEERELQPPGGAAAATE